MTRRRFLAKTPAFTVVAAALLLAAPLIPSPASAAAPAAAPAAAGPSSAPRAPARDLGQGVRGIDLVPGNSRRIEGLGFRV